MKSLVQYTIVSLILTAAASFAHSSTEIIYLKEKGNGAELVLYNSMNKRSSVINTQGWNVIYPTISSDGKYISASLSKDGKNFGIFLFDKKEESWIEVVPPNGLTIQPSFSGNSRFLSYTAPNKKGKNQIYVLDFRNWLENKKLKTFKVKTKEPGYYPCLSSGGFQVAFHISQKTSEGKLQQIAMYDFRDKKLTKYYHPENRKLPLVGKSPCFSFDDNKLTFISEMSGNWDIFEIDVTGKNLVQVTNHLSKDYSPRYLPDNSVLFSSDREGQFKFYIKSRKSILNQDQKVQKVLEGNVNIWDPRLTGNTEYKLEKASEIPGNRRSSFAALKHQDQIFVIAGHMGLEHTYPKKSFSREVHAYNLIDKRWKRVADRINPVHGVTAKGYGNFIYSFGGFAYSKEYVPKWKSISTVERYNISKNEWEEVGQLPEPRSSNAVAQINNEVYLIGGWNATPKFKGDKDGTFHKDIIVFDLKTENYSVLKDKMIRPLRRAFTAVEWNGKIVVAGGITQGGKHFDLLDEVRVFDPETENWTELPSLPFSNFAPAIENIDGTLYFFGGMKLTENGYKYVNYIYKLDPENKSWVHTGRFLSERKGFVQPVKMDSQTIGLLGGHTYDNKKDGPVSTFEIFSTKK